MIDLQDLTPIGFGCYRISEHSPAHMRALEAALDKGCNLFDTASNYKDGQSEKALGKIIQSNRKDIFVVTKAGYISSFIEKELGAKLLNFEGVINVNDKFKYCIDPAFLDLQISHSLSRLHRDHLDGFMLHNPDYLFLDPSTSTDQFYEKIGTAFEYLEGLVTKGVLRYYGISSNIIPSSPFSAEQKEFNLNQFVSIANEVASNHHFKIIQFPFNLAEKQAILPLEDQPSGSLLQQVKAADLISFSNRPFNARIDKSLVRLLPYQNQDTEYAPQQLEDALQLCITNMDLQLKEKKYDGKLLDFPVMQYLLTHYKSFTTAMFIESFYHKNFLPFLLALYDQKLPENIANLLPNLEAMLWSSYKNNISCQAVETLTQIGRADLLAAKAYQELPKAICNEYLSSGINHVLVGMKHEDYVNSLY